MHIGTAGWSIPPQYKEYFPATGSHLERYSRVFNAVEINSTFYKLPRSSTVERWVDRVPENVRFAVKTPRRITHELRMTDAQKEIDEFIELTLDFKDRLGPLLIQLPPSLGHTEEIYHSLVHLREIHSGALVIEPRHTSWSGADADRSLRELGISRVHADPVAAPGLECAGGHPSLVYFRLHGSPRKYWSAYTIEALRQWALRVKAVLARGNSAWVIFDNTARGAATGDALALLQEILPELLSDTEHGDPIFVEKTDLPC